MTGRPRTGWARFVEIACAVPDKPAIVGDAGVVRFSDLLDQALRYSARFAPRLSPGGRAVVWSENSTAMAAAILGVWSVGAIPVLLGRETALRHVRHAIERTQAELLIVDPALDASARDLLACELVLLGDLDVPCPHAAGRCWPAATPGSIVMTSGSTGLPKGVVQTQRTLRLGQRSVARSLGLGTGDAVLCASPWSFDFGWGQLLNTLLMGMTQVLAAGAAPLAITAAIERHRPTILAVSAPALAGLTHGVSELGRRDMTALRMATTSGARVPKDVVEAWRRLVPGAALSLNYGLTETYRSTSLPVAEAFLRPESVGVAVPGVRIAVVDESGRPLPRGVVGEVVHSGVGVFEGYWGDPDATARIRRMLPDAGAARPSVFTGDLGWLDRDGRLTLVGRRDRQLKAMGVRICPEEVERFLLDTGLVRDVAVTTVERGVHGDFLFAAIVPASPAGADVVQRLRQACRAELSAAMRPRVLALVEALPRTPNGKVDYPALHRSYAAGAAPLDPVAAS